MSESTDMKYGGFNLKNLFFIILFLLVVISVDIISDDDSLYTEESNYIKSLNIFLDGKVVNVYELKYGHNYGIVTIDINSTSLRSLDERTKRERYMGFIKNDVGYFVVGTISDFKYGDSIVIKSDVYDLYRDNDKIKDEKFIDLPMDNIFKPYREINQRLNKLVGEP